MAPQKKPSAEQLQIQQKQLDLQIQQSKLLQDGISKGLKVWEKHLAAKLKQIEGPKIRYAMIGLLSILVLVVLISGSLVYVGRVDASNFTFLLGTLTGAVITLLGDLLLPEQK